MVVEKKEKNAVCPPFYVLLKGLGLYNEGYERSVVKYMAMYTVNDYSYTLRSGKPRTDADPICGPHIMELRCSSDFTVQLWFVPDDQPAQGAKLWTDGTGASAVFKFRDFPLLLDTLRNEKPVYVVTVMHAVPPSDAAMVYIGPQGELVGEGEAPI